MTNLNNEFLNNKENTTQDYRNKGNGLMSPLDSMSERASTKADALATDWSKVATRYSKTGLEYIKENPAKGAAIAALSGWAIGNLIMMAFRPRR